MSQLESACRETEEKAAALMKAAKQIERAAAALQKAARQGDHARIKSAENDVRAAKELIGTTAHSAATAWPFDDDEMTTYLSSNYETDLIDAAREAGFSINKLDDLLAAFPIVMQVQTSSRALRIDKKRSTALRPARVIEAIQARRKSAGARPQQFIETLFRAYGKAVDAGDSGALLVDLYDLLTLHPETRRAYTHAEFARDVLLLDSSGLRTTRSGAEVSFVGSTGTKGGRKVLVVFDQNGNPKHYYGVRFTEATA